MSEFTIDDAVELPAYVQGWLGEYNRIKFEIKKLEEQADIARAHVELALGENPLGTINGNPVIKFAYIEQQRFDGKKAKEILTPEQVESCTVTTRMRQFRPIMPDDDL